MKLLDKCARAAGMSDEAWRRHANPWSVWTRFAAIPLMMLAIWSRVWIGWWALAPVGVVVLWLWWNPRAFAPVDEPVAWSSRGIYGERLWLQDRSSMPAGFAVVQRIWIVGAVVGAALLTWGSPRCSSGRRCSAPYSSGTGSCGASTGWASSMTRWPLVGDRTHFALWPRPGSAARE